MQSAGQHRLAGPPPPCYGDASELVVHGTQQQRSLDSVQPHNSRQRVCSIEPRSAGVLEPNSFLISCTVPCERLRDALPHGEFLRSHLACFGLLCR